MNEKNFDKSENKKEKLTSTNQIKTIKFHNFYKYLTCQPFFVWNEIDSAIDFEDNTEFQNQLIEKLVEKNWNSYDVKVKTFYDSTAININKIIQNYEDFFYEKFKNETIYIVSSSKTEDKIKETEKALKDSKVNFIFKGVYQYKNAVSEIFIFDKKNLFIYDINIYASTKRKNLIKAFWKISIINELLKKEQKKIQEYFICLPRWKYSTKKREINLVITKNCFPSKNSPALPKKIQEEIYTNWKKNFFKDDLVIEIEQNLKKTIIAEKYLKKSKNNYRIIDQIYQSQDWEIEFLEENTLDKIIEKNFYKFCKEDFFLHHINVKKIEKFQDKLLTCKKNKIKFLDINSYIEKINQIKNVKLTSDVFLDDNFYGKNIFLDSIKKKFIDKKIFYSGNFLKSKDMKTLLAIKNLPKKSFKEIKNFLEINIPEITKTSFFENINKLFLIEENQEKIFINKNFLEEILPIKKMQTKKIIWYDFEGFSMPYSILERSLPSLTLIFQCSIIETYGLKKEIKNHNLIYDPINFEIENYFEIINKIYSDKADFFIVYNKTYENSKLKEIVNLIYQKYGNSEIYLNYFSKVKHILENTIDLAKIFQIKNANYFLENKFAIFIPKLKGFYGIKKIEKFISENNIQVKRKIIQYKNLEVKNGMEAMEMAIKRELGLIGENTWLEKIKELKKYCENDVRAMIMVYDFIDLLLSKNYPNIIEV